MCIDYRLNYDIERRVMQNVPLAVTPAPAPLCARPAALAMLRNLTTRRVSVSCLMHFRQMYSIS